MLRTKYKELDNKVIRFVLTNDERYRLYKSIHEAKGKILLRDISQQMTPFRPDPDIVEKFTAIMKRETGENFILADMCFARYELVQSSNKEIYNPRLELHKDVNFEGPRVVLDYQVASNIDWDLIIQKDGEENINSYTLKDNDLLIFSGTDQMHGRVKRDFVEGEYLELLFMHFSKTGEGVDPKQIMNVQNR
jgi:hypothetical protein